MRDPITCLFVSCTLLCACAAPTDIGKDQTTASPGTQASRKDDAEVVTGSRIPVRGAQPVRTIDKDEITRNTGVIGVPAKGN